MSIFKACDIRGVVEQELDEPLMRRIGRSLGGLLRAARESTICVGGDFRRSTPPFQRALVEGLLELGIDVVDVGQVPTPVVYFAGRHLACTNVAIVTASHNPGRYNGLKFMVAGRPAVPDLVRQVEAGLELQTGVAPRGRLTVQSVLPSYETSLLECAADLCARILGDALRSLGSRSARVSDPAELADRRSPENSEICGQPGGSVGRPATASSSSGRSATAPREPVAPSGGFLTARWTAGDLKLVVDTMGGATTGIAAGVLARAGYDVVSLTDHIDPDFAARSPNPAQDANLQPLIDRVVAEQADLGIALDGDGDRVIFVDAAGRIARPEQIGVLLSRGCYEQPTVVYDLKCASVLARAVEAVGGTAIMCPSGHGFIRSLMLQRQADLGVEVSGHHFFGALGGGDDGLLTALVVCRLLTAAGLPLARLLAAIGWPAITPDLRIPFRGDAASLLEQIAASCGGQVSRLDGVRARYEDGWALARGSITEPAVTLRFEGGDRRRVTDIAERFLAGVPELRQRVLSLLDFPGRDRVPEDGE